MASIDTEGFLLPADNGPLIRTFIRRHKEPDTIAMIDDSHIDGESMIYATCPVNVSYGDIPLLLTLAHQQFKQYGWNEGDVISGQWKNVANGGESSNVCSLDELRNIELRDKIGNLDDYVAIDMEKAHLQFDAYPHYDTNGEAYSPNGETLRNNGAKTMCLTSKLNVGNVLVELLIGAGSISESERASYQHLFSRIYGAYEKP